MLEKTNLNKFNKLNSFFKYVQLQPLNYLVFSDKNTRGSSSNKAHILIKNISNMPITYRVVQKKDDNLLLKVRPFIQLLLPNEEKKIEILNDLDLIPTLNDRIIIEIVEYKYKIEEWTPRFFQDSNLLAKDKKSYEYKLYQTNLLNIISYEYQLNQIENRILKIEDNLLKWFKFESKNTRSIQITISSLVLAVLTVLLVKKYLSFDLKLF